MKTLRNPFYIHILLLLMFILQSCESEPVPPVAETPLVVEGWIEDGASPVVLVTHAANLLEGVDNFDDCVEKWARVTIDDGNGPVLLHAKIDKSYIPAIVYTTSEIKGKVEGEYHIKVETENNTVEAVTRIPKVTRLKKFIVSHLEGNDSLRSLHALVNVDPETEGYYKFFTKVNSAETRYYSSFLGTHKASEYNPEEGWEVCKGIHATNSEKGFTPFYHPGDTVAVKFCAMDETGYRFWSDYENLVSLGSNMFFPVSHQCFTNIEGNGRGYWLGYGVSYGKIVIPE